MSPIHTVSEVNGNNLRKDKGSRSEYGFTANVGIDLNILIENIHILRNPVNDPTLISHIKLRTNPRCLETLKTLLA